MDDCSNCGAPLTAEERLLNALFSVPFPLCDYCLNVLDPSRQCSVCGKFTSVLYESIPYCPEHLYQNVMKKGDKK